VGHDDPYRVRRVDVTALLEHLAAAILPDPRTAMAAALVALLVGGAGAAAAARLRSDGMQVAYTRKVFHFVIFTAAAGVHAGFGLPGTMVFGTVIAALVVGAVLRGDGHPFYEALARDRDRPHRTLFIVVPLITTAVGGLVSALVAGPFASVGYLAAGWGDAVGEPVGARWGRHRYRVPSLAGVPATRSWEGSAAVLVVASVGSGVALGGLGGVPWWGAVACGAVAAAVEGVSNHGLDNLTVQIVPSVVASLLFGSLP
jgi:phytol kinase